VIVFFIQEARAMEINQLKEVTNALAANGTQSTEGTIQDIVAFNEGCIRFHV
jgi:hypothetical protein